jgi:hypothetical protein
MYKLCIINKSLRVFCLSLRISLDNFGLLIMSLKQNNKFKPSISKEMISNVLETNADLIKRCVELQNTVDPDALPELRAAQERLQKNLLWLSSVIDENILE